MNRIEPYRLWVGHGGDESDVVRLYDVGIEAVLELAVEEPAFLTPRELICCRVPLIDGAGNSPERLALAVDTLAALLTAGTPTLICCGAGMSRSVAVAAVALARVEGGSPRDWLTRVAHDRPSDVSPGFWSEIAPLARPTQRVLA